MRWSAFAILGSAVLLATATSSTPFPVSPNANWTSRGGTLNYDRAGWSGAASIAAAQDGSVYVVWQEDQNPGVLTVGGTDRPGAPVTSIYAKRYVNGSWQSLGRVSSGALRYAYHPAVTILNNTPYVIWTEGGGIGCQWGPAPTDPTIILGCSIFVAHWDGTQWVRDASSSQPNGSLHISYVDPRNGRTTSFGPTI